MTNLNPRRYTFIYLFLSLFILALFLRLCYVHLFKADFLKELAKKQHTTLVQIEPLRGKIYDRNLSPLAINVPTDSLYAVPREIIEKEETASLLSQITGLSYDFVYERISRDKLFVWIGRKLPQEVCEKIRHSGIKGVGFIEESRRSYPKGYLGSHVIGFAGTDNYGLEGIELLYNKTLSGKEGWALFLRDARQRKLTPSKLVPAKDGYSVVLNIDEVIQFIAEEALDKAVKKYRAKAATIVVIDPYTGRILALANRPTFDPNKPSSSSADERRNRAITDFFEPGSVFKIVTAAAALEEGIVKEEDKFFCENGEYRVGSHILHDHQPHGTLTFTGVISESSNIGTTKVAQKVGPALIFEYIKRFGFGKTLGVDFQGEVAGIIRHPSAWSKTSIAAIPIGQEVAVTSLQLAAAISAVANGGLLMKPFLVDSVIDISGNKVEENYPTLISQVMNEETARRLTAVLVQVVESGTGRMAKVEGMLVAGKTGTAQKVVGGTYSHSQFFASFIGFAPADKPQLAMVVVFDEPHPYYGGVVAAPVFKEVLTKAVSYLSTRSYTAVDYEAK